MSGHVDVLTGAGAGIVVVVLVASIIGLTRPRAGLTHVVWGAGFVVVVGWRLGGVHAEGATFSRPTVVVQRRLDELCPARERR